MRLHRAVDRARHGKAPAILDCLFDLPQTSPVVHELGVIVLVCAAGMAVGSIKIRGIGLGSDGVLFMGILAAQSPSHPETN